MKINMYVAQFTVFFEFIHCLHKVLGRLIFVLSRHCTMATTGRPAISDTVVRFSELEMEERDSGKPSESAVKTRHHEGTVRDLASSAAQAKKEAEKRQRQKSKGWTS